VKFRRTNPVAMQHRRSDPACIQYRPRRTRVDTWKYHRARGLPCPVCEATRRDVAALEAETEAVRVIIEEAAIADVDRGRRFTETTDDLRRFTS
jgi:hypothetical protein